MLVYGSMESPVKGVLSRLTAQYQRSADCIDLPMEGIEMWTKTIIAYIQLLQLLQISPANYATDANKDIHINYV